MIRALVAVFLLSGCQMASNSISQFTPGGPNRGSIERLESKVVMPAGAKPLAAYLRTYYPHEGKIVGLYRLGERTGVRSLPALDFMVLDGGCEVVTVQYDPVTDVIGEALCNGTA